MYSISKKLYYVILISIILNTIKIYFAQNNIETTIAESTFGWYYKCFFYSNILITIVSVISFLLYRKFFPFYLTFCYISLIVFVFLASFKSFGEIMKTPSALYSTKGIGTYINIGLIFFTAEIVYTKKILKLFYYLCFFFTAAGLINLAKVGIGASRTEFFNAVLEFALYLIWVFPYFFIRKGQDKKTNLINVIVYLILFIFILSIGSRSYILIYFIFLIVKFKDQLKTKNSLLIIFGMGLAITSVFFIFSNSGLGKVLEGAFSNLSDRASEDSRSGQLQEFLGQYDFNSRR